MRINNVLALSLASMPESNEESPYDMKNFSGVLGQAQAEVEEETRKAALEELKEVLRTLKQENEFQVDHIRTCKRQIRRAKEHLAQNARALAYAQETNDFGPLLCRMGKTIAVREAGGTTEVPKDWQPSKKTDDSEG